MKKKTAIIASLLALCACNLHAAKENTEKSITVNGTARKYVLYVPDNVKAKPAVVFSLHGASGHDTDRLPFRTSVADAKGCIVVYPQGVNQYFPVLGGSVTGWNSTGTANEDLDFFKAVIEDVAKSYSIDRARIYCCGFSNGGMMTYSNVSSASDVFAAYASISGFQLNEFHQRITGARPVPFLHIHGKADGFVKYACMPVIRDNMVARCGCNPVPKVTTVSGRYTKSIYEAGEGGFPYVYYEVDDMGHSDYTDRTDDGNSALTMWNFISQYALTDACDKTLKWRLNIDAEGFKPEQHNWKVNAARTLFEYGTPKKADNADNNVYPSLQFEAGNYKLCFATTGTAGNKIYVKVETLDGKTTLFSKWGKVGETVVMPFTVTAYAEYKITIVKTAATDKFTTFAFHSCEAAAVAQNSGDGALPDVAPDAETGYLITIPQDQGKQYDTFTRTAVTTADAYNTYTANGDLQIAFKMMNVDVKNCDYVIVKFAEAVAAGWKLAFWEGTNLTDVPEKATEYKFELEASMLSSGILPQICLMTYFGGYTAPLVAKVAGVYKHCTLPSPDAIQTPEASAETPQPAACYSLSGARIAAPGRGLSIVKMSDGTARKIATR
jgi:poly(3-hydroxybutyrate) depolymerase